MGMGEKEKALLVMWMLSARLDDLLKRLENGKSAREVLYDFIKMFEEYVDARSDDAVGVGGR